MFTDTCKDFPNTCKMFLNAAKIITPKSEYAGVIAQVLKNECRRNNIKTVMRWADASSRSIQNWKTGNNMPSAESLIMLTGHSDEMLNAWLCLAGRPHIIPMIRFMDMVLLIKDPVDTIECMWKAMPPEFKRQR